MTKTVLQGTVGFPVKKKLVYRDADFVEITDGRRVPPGKKTASAQRAEMPADMGCTVQLSRLFATAPKNGAGLKGTASDYGQFQVNDHTMELWHRQCEYAATMKAHALVLVTPPSITPSGKSLTNLSNFLRQAPKTELPMVWEPHGPWVRHQADAFARDHHMVLATDPLHDPVPAGPLAYFRFGPFAALGSQMGLYDLERILEAAYACDADLVLCAFETQRSLDDVRNLKKVAMGLDDEGFDY